MGNRLSVGSALSEAAIYIDDSDAPSDSSADQSAVDSSATSAAEDVATEEEPVASGGLRNHGFAPSLKDLTARAAVEAPAVQPSQPAVSRTRICPILQNGRQVTKDFYWVLPERTGRQAALPALQPVANEDDEYQNLDESPPKPPPRRVCRSESSGSMVTGASNSATSQRLCRRAASSVSSATPAAASTVATAAAAAAAVLTPRLWRKSLVTQVRLAVPGVTEDEVRLALGLHHGNSELASRYLKVEQLFRLGLADRSDCLAELQSSDWCLETAGAALAYRFSGY